MSRTVAIGIQDFEEIQNGNYFYVDKTEFIREWWNNGDSVTLITRPRRFGKTLTLDMVEKFFSVKYAGRSDLFEGLKIWDYPEFRELQGTIPVIKISFADIEEENFEEIVSLINNLIVKVYTEYNYLKNDNHLDSLDLDLFNSVSMTMSRSRAVMAISNLSTILEHYYGKKPIILIDEYDVPMQSAWIHGFWEELADFMRRLFRSTLKSNKSMCRGLLTGITRVSKENIFSGLNHLRVCTVISKKYSTAFGFTEEEVKAALKDYDLAEQFQEVKGWYDGFKFGEVEHIYNPWSILNFLSDRELKPYWCNSSSNDLIERLAREGDANIKTSLENLLLGKLISSEIIEDMVFSQLNHTPKAIWSLMLSSGYLSIESYCETSDTYNLKVANYEVRKMLKNMFYEWFYCNARISYTKFLNALLSKNVQEMNENLNKVLIRMTSFFDTHSVKGSEVNGYNENGPECFYHGLILGLVASLDDSYVISSNRESGNGRYDVLFIPRQEGDLAMILEFKVTDSSTNMNKTVQTTLAQINEKEYDTELLNHYVPKESIVHYGFAFSHKQVLIGMEDSTGVTIPELLQEDEDFHGAKASKAF